MPVAQRYHVPVRRNTAVEDGEPDANGDRVPSSSLPTAAIGEKITITAPRAQRVIDEPELSDGSAEPDWDKLAEKIMPLLRDRLLAERDRLGW
ncbi:MAG: hypothetical protein R2873_10170 [Caldilineaceae bacterium]